MAFGQAAGPPATAKQVQQLTDLLHAAGHSDFRDARGPMGFNQRQAAGRFTRDEADTFIGQLEAEAEDQPAPFVTPAPGPPSTARVAVGDLPSEQMAAELQRRGWLVIEP
jgi:hypothetical protein